MENLDTVAIRVLEIHTNLKLREYISKNIHFENPIRRDDFPYPEFNKHLHKKAYEMWLSMDFITSTGKSFIGNFLDEKSDDLTCQEIEILRDRDESHMRVLQLINADGPMVRVLDLLENQFYDLWDPLHSLLDINHNYVHCEADDDLGYEGSGYMELGYYINSILLARVGKLFGRLTFIEDVHHLNPSAKPVFLQQIFLDFNRLKTKRPRLTINEYLKENSLKLYNIYTNCIFDSMGLEKDHIADFYMELDEFEDYIQVKAPNQVVRKHLTILMELFDNHLFDSQASLYSLHGFELGPLLKDCIHFGTITSHEDFHSYISTLKTYLEFLSKKNPNYKQSYQDILEVSRNRFSFLPYFESTLYAFKIDTEFSNLVAYILNEEALSLLMDFDKFLFHIIENPLELTGPNNYIQEKDLFEIQDLFVIEDFPNKESPNQEDFLLIDLFVELALYLRLLKIEDNTLYQGIESIKYFKLSDKDKYTLLFQSLWGMDYFPNESEFISKHYFKLLYFGILKSTLYPSYEIEITKLGQAIFRFFRSKHVKKLRSSVIYLENFKNDK